MSILSMKVKKFGAVAMAAALILGQLPISAVAASRGGTDNGADGSEVITAFAAIPENIALQKLPVGAKESDISFPSTLTATVLVGNSQDDNAGSGSADDNKETGSDESSTGGSGEQDKQSGQEESSSGSGSESGTSQEIPTQEGTGTGAAAPQNTDNNSASESGSSSESEQSETPQEGSDSASIKSLIDYIDSFTLPEKVYAAEEGTGELTTKEVQVEGITWTLNALKSSAATFSSDKAGDSFEYTAVLPATYKTEAQLPTIKVTIVNPEELNPDRKEFGTVEYIGEDKEKTTIDSYLAIRSSDEKVEWKDDWYVLGRNAEISGEITMSGKVNLILADGYTLKITKSHITAEKGTVLKIFGQEKGTGALVLKYEAVNDPSEATAEPAEDFVIFNAADGDIAVFGGTVDVDAVDYTAISADNLTISGGNVLAKGKTGVIAKTTLEISGGKTEISSIGSEKVKSGDIVFGISDKEDQIKINGSVYIDDDKSIKIADKILITDGTDLYKGTYNATSDPTYKVFGYRTLKMAEIEATPNASLSASGTQTGKLKGLVAKEKYILSGAGLSKTEITADETGLCSITSGLKAGDLEIVKEGKEGTFDSEPQIITVTKAANPSGLKATACTNEENNDGAITGLDSTKKYEYREQNDTKYTAAASGVTSISGLKNGVYLVRLRPIGAMLASASLKLEVKAYVAGKVETPTFYPSSGTYTSSQQVKLSTKTEGATIYYTTDGSTPSTSSRIYSGPITVDSRTTIKAFAVKEGMTKSSLASASYAISTTVKKATDTVSNITKGITSKTKTGTTKSSTATTKSSSATTKSSTAATKSSTAKSSTATAKKSATKSKSSLTGKSSTTDTTRNSANSKAGAYTRKYTTGNSDSDTNYDGIMGENNLDTFSTEETGDLATYSALGESSAESGIISQDGDMLVADASADEDGSYDEDYAAMSDFDGIGFAGSLDIAQIMTAVIAAIALGAVIFVCLKNKKNSSVSA